jgi:hypothetical protein
MVRLGFSDPVGQRFTDTMPTFISRRLRPAEAAAATVAGIESRAPRIIVPGFWNVWFALRGILNPLLDRLMERDERFLAILREADDPERPRAGGGITPAAGSEDAATPAGAA